MFWRRMRELVEALGLVDVGHEGIIEVCRGEELSTRFLQMTFETAVRPLVATGVITEEQYTHYRRLFQDPTFFFISPELFAAWGRRVG